MAKVIAFQIEINGVDVAIKNERELEQAVAAVNKAYKSADFGSEQRAKAIKQVDELRAVQKASRDELTAQSRAAKDAAKEQEAAAKARARAEQQANEIASGSIKGLRLELKQLQDEYQGLSREQREASGPDVLARIGRVKNEISQYTRDVREAARAQVENAEKGERSYRSINAELVRLRARYKDLSEAERGLIGPQFLSRIQKLDTELKGIDAQLGQYQRNVGNYAGGITEAFGSIGGVDFAAIATPAGATAAAVAAIGAGVSQINQLTQEFNALRGAIRATTGAADETLDQFTSRTIAVAETFGKSQDEIRIAASSVANTLDLEYGEALDRISEGFITGSDASGEFLDSTREYGAIFRDANLSANDFFNVLNAQARNGIYSDKGIDAVKEATLRLRELPTATQAALDAIGVDQVELSELIERDGVGAAIKTVSRRLGELDKDSAVAGQAIADIFGGPGEDAGFDFLVQLEDVIGAERALIDTTDEYQAQQARTLAVNEEFARAQAEVAAAFGATGESTDDLVTQGKTLLLEFAIPLIEGGRRIFEALQPAISAIYNLGVAVGLASPEGDAFSGIMDNITSTVNRVATAVEIASGIVEGFADGLRGIVEFGRDALVSIGLVNEAQAEADNFGGAGAGGDFLVKQAEANDKRKQSLAGLREEIDKNTQATKDYNATTKTAAVIADQFAAGSIADLQNRLQALRKELNAAAPGQDKSILSDILGVEEAIDELKSAQTEIRNELTRGLIPPPSEQLARLDGILPPPDLVLQRVRDTGRLIDAELTEQFERRLTQNQRQNERVKTNDLQAEQDKQDAIVGIANQAFSTLNAISAQLNTSNQLRADEEVERVNEQYEAQILAAGSNGAAIVALREQQAAEVEAIREQEFEQQKRYRIAEATAALAQGIINILTAPTTIPDPFGAIYKGVQVGFLTLQTGIQIANINQQRADLGALIAQDGAIVDGFVRGPSHRHHSGGVQTVLNGQRVLVEGDEFIDRDEFGGVAVVNRRSTAANRPLLKQLHGKIFPGKRALLSSINSQNGYGIAYAERGGLAAPSLDGLAAVSGSGATSISADSVALIAQAVAEGAAAGTAAGAGDANRRREREGRARRRTQ